MDARITIALAVTPVLFTHDTESRLFFNSTKLWPDASNSKVATVGTGIPGVMERMMAPPPSVPASASNVTKGVVAPAAARASVSIPPITAHPTANPRQQNRCNVFDFIR
jgi:hypothetical protein